MAQDFAVSHSAHWKALSHPLRLGVLNSLMVKEMTNEQLASALGVESGKLYFHTKKLLDAGMIEVAETRAKGPVIEKYYRAVAQRFIAEPSDDGSREPTGETFFSAAVQLYREARAYQNSADTDSQLGFHLVLPQSSERVQHMIERLRSLAAEFQEQESVGDDTRMVSFCVLLHTIFSQRSPVETSQNGT